MILHSLLYNYVSLASKYASICTKKKNIQQKHFVLYSYKKCYKPIDIINLAPVVVHSTKKIICL